MKTVISSKGQIVVPAAIRQQDNILPGQEFEIERLKRGEYLLRRTGRRNESLVRLLLDCPVKGWFRAASRNETTGDFSRRKCDEFGLMVATHNVRDFQMAGVPVLDPFA